MTISQYTIKIIIVSVVEDVTDITVPSTNTRHTLNS